MNEQSQDKMTDETIYQARTKICLEQASAVNPYQAEKLYLAGYDIESLADNISPSDMYFLMFTGQLSSNATDRKLLETLMILLGLPSPRHPASRAAMFSGISKTNPEHILPISLSTIGGEQLGAAEVGNCYQFITNNKENSITEVVTQLLENTTDEHQHIAPGFGRHYGSVDPLVSSFFQKIYQIKPNGETIKWVHELLKQLSKHQWGLLDVGLAACVFHELSFGQRESVGLYQLLRAPGLLAYGMEQTHKPLSHIPMLKDENYELKDK